MKNLLKIDFFQSVAASVAALYIRLVFWTSCWTRINFEIPLDYLKKKKPFITCFWHARLLMLPYAWPGGKHTFYMLISAHKDGRLISKTVHHFDIETIAGSTQRGGTEALLQIVRLSKQGKTIGMTPDGPRGPRFQVSEGTVMAAYLAKADLIPVTYAVRHRKILKTWDRFFLPWPFSRGLLMWGEPVAHPRTKEQLPEVQKRLKRALDDLNHKAEGRLAR